MSSYVPTTTSRSQTSMAAPTTIPSRDSKLMGSKQHRRSRSGCFTCRLRRKKCDEIKPACKACKHLGLKCEYKRPTWWGNNELRRDQKDFIKDVIKRTQLTKNTTQPAPPPPCASTPPSLCHSVPTFDGSDSLAHSRSASIDSHYHTNSSYAAIPSEDYFGLPTQAFVGTPHAQYPLFSPYEVDIKTERQIYVNDVPTRRDSTISTFSTFQPPPTAGLTPFPAESWVQQDYFESSKESFAEEYVDFDYFEFPHGQITPNHETLIEVDEADRPLLDHFIDKVMKLIFPVLDANQHGHARTSVILPALESNRCYLHCCLNAAGVHRKATQRLSGDTIDGEIMRHRYATITELCAALQDDTNHSQILEATLGLIFFQTCVGRPDDSLPDIPWHQHFQAAISLVEKLDLASAMMAAQGVFGDPTHPPFNMTLTAWIDILGATMLGRSPIFADTYRDQNIAGTSIGLEKLMGCDDHTMFLISEIACLEARKLEGIDEVMLCKYIEILGTEISRSEPPPGAIVSAISATGAIRPKQLSINMTAVFRLAARIYLCAMVPGFSLDSPSIVNLVSAFVDAMGFIPAGAEGFDRSLAWPMLIAGSVSLPTSPFRNMFAERCGRLGEAAEFGSFGRVRDLLADVWAVNDVGVASGLFESVHWRNVMNQKGWDSLLI